MNLSDQTTAQLLTRFRLLESASRYARAEEALRLYKEWRAIRQELNARPLEEVLAG